jgi:hypothetical protein
MLHQMRTGADPARPAYTFCGGCLAFTDGLRRVTWPCKFHPGITFKYDRTTVPQCARELVPAGAKSVG